MVVAPAVEVRRFRLLAATVIFGLVSISWPFAAAHSGPTPPGNYEASAIPDWPLSENAGKELRRDALKRAVVRLDEPAPLRGTRPPYERYAEDETLACRFLRDNPSGTSAKFDCVLPDGDVVKVKYGRNSEIHAEVAASRVLSALGFPADEVEIVPRIRCYGCPRYPFLAMQLLFLTSSTGLLAPNGHADAFTDFEWVAVEHKFPAAAIETSDTKGWAWWEVERVSYAELDALRLVAIFLAHWDNKSENQRLVCLDGIPSGPDQPCARPMAMIQDVGSTFGPVKMNLGRWREVPMWDDRKTCAVSLRSMPFGGGTFPDIQISEEGRALAVRLFSALDDEAVRHILVDARFGAFYSSTDDTHDLEAWVDAFRHRIDQLATAGPCPASPQSP